VVTAAATEPETPYQPLLSSSGESETPAGVGESFNQIMPPIELTEQVTDFSGPEFSISEFSPQKTTSVFDPVGKHVPIKLKQQIWEGKYIDMALLLKSGQELDDQIDSQGQIQLKNGAMCLVKQKVNSYLSIADWTSAYVVFMSVMLEKYRTRAQELIKYMRDIRIAAGRSPGWYKYDEQYRLKKQSDPQSSWGIINSELWLLYTNNPYPKPAQKSNLSQNQATKANQNTQNYSRPPQHIMYCNSFNSGRRCNFSPNCRYAHRCNRCGGGHPAAKCWTN
jgi:hypothetical protein